LYSYFLFSSQAATFEVHGLKLNGKLTCGENIADLGGVKLSLRALKRHLAAEKVATGGQEPILINGFTPEQRLFLAWSQAWRENGKFWLCYYFFVFTFSFVVISLCLFRLSTMSCCHILKFNYTVKKERAVQLVTLDPHGPNEMRCNGTLSNVSEFLEVRILRLWQTK
jgi:putative endopeptidase